MKYIYILLLISFCSCDSLHKVSNKKTESISEPKILFLNYKIYKTSTDVARIKLLHKIIAKGILKTSFYENNNPKKGDIKCTQINSKSMSVDSVFLSNPLIKIIEYVNDSGQFEKKTIVLDSAEFSIRMPLNPTAKFITTSSFHLNQLLSKDKL